MKINENKFNFQNNWSLIVYFWEISDHINHVKDIFKQYQSKRYEI